MIFNCNISPVSNDLIVTLRRALLNGSRLAMSSGAGFENFAPRALLWSGFETAYIFSLPIPARPNRPTPKRSMVDGSGMADVVMLNV